MRWDREWYSLDPLEAPGVVEALVAEAEAGYERLGAEFVSRPPDEEIEALRRDRVQGPGEGPQSRPETR